MTSGRLKDRPRTLSEIIALGGNFHVSCYKCPRSSTIDGPGLIRYFAARCWPEDLESAKPHLRCVKCGAKGPLIERSAETPLSPGWQPPQTEQEWKALVRRLRG
jgi:hypothetical protein